MPRDFTRACKSQTSFNSRQKQECKDLTKQIRSILSKDGDERTAEEETLLKQYKPIVRLVESQRQYQLLKQTRQLEVEDDVQLLEKKVAQLAELMRASRHTVIYTGAGISTSASIPDYRGPNGVWTQLKAGFSAPAVDDLVFAEPTFTHMAIAELVRRGLVGHVVSQNCDGLHLRSGLPEERLSEIHGNMYVEVCRRCDAHLLRSFDVTERTALRRHDTGRLCSACGPEEEEAPLMDTIVHFGEKGKLKYPLKWEAAAAAAAQAELIIAIGSSLKVLRRYQCLWPLASSYVSSKSAKRKPSLVIINLQWTPKDSQATLKLNGKCDLIMQRLVAALDVAPIPPYDPTTDPVVRRAVPLRAEEEETCHRTKLEEVMAAKTQHESITSSTSSSSSVDKKLTPGWFGVGLKKK